MAEFTYDHVVIGSGISGLTAAALLAREGAHVLIVEKAPAIGGSVVRFSLEGIPFETGFHFTGGLVPGGLLLDMLRVLGIDHRIRPLSFSENDGIRFVFESSGERFLFPYSREGLISRLESSFPDETAAIRDYFGRVDLICAKTTGMNLRALGERMYPLEEDYRPLSAALDSMFKDERLRAILAGYCLCYGATPEEVSFANHARMAQGMHDGIVHVEGGGEAFVEALREKLDRFGVDIRCNTHVVACEEIETSKAGAFRLNTGDLVRFKSAVLTIHPQEILKLLPTEKLRPAFVNRVGGLQSSFGFMAVFGVCDTPDLIDDFILLSLPDTDLNKALAPGARDADSVLFGISSEENGTRTLTVLEAACPEDFEEWAESSLKRRPEAYTEFKAWKTERILERIYTCLPELKGHFKCLDSSTPLTFRDYLCSPDGSAYGIKQLVGQFNILGRLPIKNLYAAGQSSVLPGIMGAMVSSFMVCRQIRGGEEFDRFIGEQLEGEI